MSDLQSQFDFRANQRSLSTTVPTELCQADSRRVYLLISNRDAIEDIYVWPELPGGDSSVIFLPQGSPPLSVTIKDAGPITELRWLGLSAGAGAAGCGVIQSLYQPRRQRSGG